MIRNAIATFRLIAGWVNTVIISSLAILTALVVGPRRSWLIWRQRWGQSSLGLLDVDYDVVGAEHMQKAAFFVSNHQSLIDVVLLPAFLPKTTAIVAKAEIAYVPFLGWFFSRSGGLMVDRSNPRRALQTMREGIRKLPAGWSVAVFPEGTRSPDGELQKFKKGAFRIAVEGNLPVVPIGLHGARDVVAKDGWLIRPGRIYVTIGAPIDTSTWSMKTLETDVETVHQAVNRCIEFSKARAHQNAAPHSFADRSMADGVLP